jgi:diadenosine tetraphosphate (Ap4A) HIT family hydrolase
MGRHSTDDELLADWRVDRLGAARSGSNPMVLARMRSGYAVLGDNQHLPGYCVLMADFGDPDGEGPDHLTDLDRGRRAAFLTDMGLLGEAVFAVCSGLDPAFRRVNYEILGNLDRYLHAHVHARYGWEPQEYVNGPVGRYPADVRHAPEHAADDRHDPLREALVKELARVMADAYHP